ncbi:hypothetical protein ACVINI_005879 [Rhizobium beringeri]
MMAPEIGVCGSGLLTVALPNASAAAIEQIESTSGKLKGEITPTIPCGTRLAKLVRPSIDGINISSVLWPAMLHGG